MLGRARSRSPVGTVLIAVILLSGGLGAIHLSAPASASQDAGPAGNTSPGFICGFPIYKSLAANQSHTGSRYLAATSEHAYIYVDSGNPTQDEINKFADEFDTVIWPSDTTVFGTISRDKINIHLQVMDGPGGLGGYYYPGTWDIYIDSADLSIWGDEIAAHEFEHLIHDKYDNDENLWVNEGMADMAIHLIYGPNAMSVSGHLDAFENDPDNDLTVFENQMYDYGSAYAFMLWVWEHFGGNSTLKTIVADTQNGFAGILEALRSVDIDYSFTDTELFSMWSVANILDDTNDMGGIYGYYSVDLSMYIEGSYDTYPVSQSSDVNSWANDYYGFKNGDKRDLVVHVGRLDGTINFSLIGIGPGNLMIKSAYVDSSVSQADLTIPGFGSTHPVVYLAVSGIAGKRYTFSAELRDNTPPVTALAINPQTPDGLNGYYVTKPTIGFVTSEPATTYFHWDNDTDVKYCQSCSPPKVPLAAEGEHTLYFHSVDPEGNAETPERSVVLRVDTERPETFLDLDPIRPDGDQGWYVSKVTASLRSSENGSIFFRWDSGFFHNYSGPMAVDEGDHTLFYYSRDPAGNDGETHSMDIKLDTLSPVATCDVYPAVPDGQNGYYITQPTVALSTPEPGVTLLYSMDGSNVQFIYSQPVKIPDGTHTLSYWAMDEAGNKVEPVDRAFKVDTVAPTTKLTTTPASPDGLNGWFVTQPSVKLATDGDATPYYSLDDGQQRRYLGPLLLEEGSHRVRYFSKDRAGNVEPERNIDIKFDMTPPQTKARVEGSETSSWYLDPPIVTFQTEAGATTYYGWDGVAQNKYIVPIKPRDGTHDLTYYSVDEAGNKGGEKGLSFSVDSVDPTAYFVVVPLYGFVGDETIVDATNSTDNILVDSYSLDFGDGDVEELRGDPVINHVYILQGNYKITLTVTDEAGRKATYSRDIYIEKKPKKAQNLTSTLENPLLILLGLLAVLAIAGFGAYRYRRRKQLEQALAAYETYMAQQAMARRKKAKAGVRKAKPGTRTPVKK